MRQVVYADNLDHWPNWQNYDMRPTHILHNLELHVLSKKVKAQIFLVRISTIMNNDTFWG